MLASLAALICHLIALHLSGHSWIRSPLAELSRGHAVFVHAIGLLFAAVGQYLLGRLLRFPPPQRSGRLATRLTTVCAFLLIFSAWYFAQSAGSHAVLLWVLASLVGLTMACLWPYLNRHYLTASRVNLICLTIWIVLIPAGMLIPDSLTGAYQRLTGLVYLFWMTLVAAFMNPRQA